MDEKIQETINQLKALPLDGGSHENLSAICSVIYQPEFGWTTGACSMLRETLIDWLEQFDPTCWANGYLAEQGLRRLPKDANGENIHLGDEMQWPNGGTFEVIGIGNGVLFYTDEDGTTKWTGSYDKTHHKPTLKEALSEVLIGFGAKWDEICSGYERELAEDYADTIMRIVEASND